MREIKIIIKKVKQLYRLVRFVLFSNDSIALKFIEIEARDYLNACQELRIGNTEDIENLLFHITAYFEAPDVVKEIRFGGNVPSKKKLEYVEVVEKMRAVELACICDSLKTLPLGFFL